MARTDTLTRLVEAASEVDSLPTQQLKAQAAAFLSDHPLDAILEALSASTATKLQLDVVTAALSKVLKTAYGTRLLPSAAAYAEAALNSPAHQIRRLACEQLGRLLSMTAEGSGATTATSSAPAAANGNGSQAAAPGPEQQRAWACQLAGALADADTGVAQEANRALRAYASSNTQAYAQLLDGSSPVGQKLAQLAGSRDATLRMRVFGLLVGAAATPQAAEQLKASGMTRQLLRELDDPSDILACLAALNLVQELAQQRSAGMAGLLCDLLLPRLLQLLQQPLLAAGTLPIAAQLLAAALEAGPADMEGVKPANGHGVGDHPLLAAIGQALDERGDADAGAELVALDAAGQLAQSQAGAELITMDPSPLLSALCERALGRAPSPDVRVAALHALASLAGVERAGEARSRAAAQLSHEAETRLREAVYVAAATSGGGARSPAEAVAVLLQQPFDDLRTATYRCIAALALRTWFAGEIANNGELLAHLCNPGSESGQQGCQWRHSAVMALWATCQDVASAAANGAGAEAHAAALRTAEGTIRAAVAAGPYGSGAAATHEAHFVATVNR